MWGLIDVGVAISAPYALLKRRIETNLSSKTASRSQRANAKSGGDGLTEVGKRGARSQVHIAVQRWAPGQQRHAFAGMIGAVRCRVYAVIASNKERVAGAHLRLHVGNPGVHVT